MAPRGRLTDTAYQLVLQRLRDGDYASGQRISVEELVLELGASRQPVMDALKRLSTEGFLDIIPQVGVRVIVPQRDDFVDFFRLLANVDGLCAELAAERAEAASVVLLAEINAEFGILVRRGANGDRDAADYRAVNFAFTRMWQRWHNLPSWPITPPACGPAAISISAPPPAASCLPIGSPTLSRSMTPSIGRSRQTTPQRPGKQWNGTFWPSSTACRRPGDVFNTMLRDGASRLLSMRIIKCAKLNKDFILRRTDRPVSKGELVSATSRRQDDLAGDFAVLQRFQRLGGPVERIGAADIGF